MENSLAESLSGDRRKATEELIRGRELTQQLLLQNSIGGEISTDTRDLALKILNSFTNTIAMLSCNDSDEGSQIPVSSCLNSPLKSEDSGESCRSSAVKDRRGCYKRRKTLDTWATEDSTLVDDSHAWRKYGQKAILNAQFPRNYYRCTHKMDQGCQASKQVQRIQDHPPKYRSTYYGRHTCSGAFKSPELILDSNPSDSSILLSFDDPVCNDGRFPFFPSSSSMKQEMKFKAVSDEGRFYSSSSDYPLSPDLGGLYSPEVFSALLPSSLQSFQGEVMTEVDDYFKYD